MRWNNISGLFLLGPKKTHRFSLIQGFFFSKNTVRIFGDNQMRQVLGASTYPFSLPPPNVGSPQEISSWPYDQGLLITVVSFNKAGY